MLSVTNPSMYSCRRDFIEFLPFVWEVISRLSLEYGIIKATRSIIVAQHQGWTAKVLSDQRTAWQVSTDRYQLNSRDEEPLSYRRKLFLHSATVSVIHNFNAHVIRMASFHNSPSLSSTDHFPTASHSMTASKRDDKYGFVRRAARQKNTLMFPQPHMRHFWHRV